jgi:hypothetical protein
MSASFRYVAREVGVHFKRLDNVTARNALSGGQTNGRLFTCPITDNDQTISRIYDGRYLNIRSGA